MEIRKGTLKDLEAIAAVEAACFPAAEAATAEEFAGRLQQYGDHFWLLWAVSYTHLTLPTKRIV